MKYFWCAASASATYQITVLEKYFGQNLKLKIMMVLHLSEPTIPTIVLTWQNPCLDRIKNKKLKKKNYYPLHNLQAYVNF